MDIASIRSNHLNVGVVSSRSLLITLSALVRKCNGHMLTYQCSATYLFMSNTKILFVKLMVQDYILCLSHAVTVCSKTCDKPTVLCNPYRVYLDLMRVTLFWL